MTAQNPPSEARSKVLLSPAGAPHARILGVGGYRPSRVVTNEQICQVIDSTDEWIRTRTGIEERRWATAEETVGVMALASAGKALAAAGVEAEQIGCVVISTVTHLSQTPSLAADVANQLGAVNAAAFDISAACAGFCHGLALAQDMVRGGSADYVLVIGVERLSDLTDMNDRSTAFIFGDGAGAVVVGPSDEPQIGPVSWGSAGDLADLIYMRDDRWIYQEGQAVFRWATTQVAPIALRALEVAGLKPSDVDVLIPHQANLRIVNAIAKKLRSVGAREDMVVADDIIYSGNTSSASIPMALDHMRSAGRVSSGDVLLMVGFGAGLSYGAQVVISP
jgi:3-oxoacyl-[acyl-carrier-protein] synthase III